MPCGPLDLQGRLGLPRGADGVVLFAHGSGSSRHSPRNKLVAQALEQQGLGTLLFDLLTEDEAQDRANVFNISLLAERLLAATDWIAQETNTARLQVGYFGASTGAAAALIAEPLADSPIFAVVSRGGRPDLTMASLPRVKSPTLLIVGGRDMEVLDLNRQALAVLQTEKDLKIVPGATHLFEEPGALAKVSDLAAAWFMQHLHSQSARAVG
ncbi:MAG: dienelactone hydrolase family protein [Candidatus Hydrogenedentes bacterium]|nr:dienelactone hydrolase family protein [Candidatus Hydrogenedentota bacterium]